MSKKIILSEVEAVDQNADTVKGIEEGFIEQTDINDKKPGRIARLKAYISNKNANRKMSKQFKKEQKLIQSEDNYKSDKEKHIKDNRRLDQYLNDIENQLDKVDEQNKMLLFYLTTVKENNEALLKHISVLTKNNQQLLNHLEGAKRREKTAKIFAIISSVLAIGLSIWRILQAFGAI